MEQTFDLLALPLELRRKIYEYTLIAGDAISILQFAQDRTSLVAKTSYSLSPAVLATCWRVHDEAAPILYGSNTFYADVHMRLHQALRRCEVQKALSHLLVDDDLPEPEVTLPATRPVYHCSYIDHIRRLEIRLTQVISDQPHYSEGGIAIDHTMHDLCETFVQGRSLDLLILTSSGCASAHCWLEAAGGCRNLARGLETLMWYYHEWHFERALLAISRSNAILWLNSDQRKDRIVETGQPVFHQPIRALLRTDKLNARVTRAVSARLERAVQLKI